MARPKKTASNSAKKTTRTKKTTTATKTVKTPVEEVKTVETPVEEVKAVETPVEEVKAEVVIEEVPAEEVKAEEFIVETPAEPKPKRKYTRRAKKEEEISVVEVKEEKKSATTVKKPKIDAFIQGAGAEKSIEELANTAKKLSGVKSPKSVNLYIKPYEEDGTAKVYYVVDNIAGHFSLFE